MQKLQTIDELCNYKILYKQRKEEKERTHFVNLIICYHLLSDYINHIIHHQKFRNEDERSVLKEGRFCRFGRSVEDSAQGSVEWTYLLCSRLYFVILLTFETSRPPRGETPRVAALAFLVSHGSDAPRRRDTSFLSTKRLLREQCPPNVLVFYQVSKSLGEKRRSEEEAETRRKSAVRGKESSRERKCNSRA